MNLLSEPRIVKYQASGQHAFDYKSFWHHRYYDHRVEKIILNKYLKRYFSENSDGYLVDIGGNFGRLLSVYAPYFKEVAILDYAVNGFHDAQNKAEKYNLKLHFIAANAYYLPFTDGSQSNLISVRLIHHLENPRLFFQEIKRVLAPDGLFILQASNKNNLKFLLKIIFTLKFSLWKADWQDLPQKKLVEDNFFSLIRNYKPSYLEQLMKEQGLQIVCRRSTAWQRGLNILHKSPFCYLIERFLQSFSVILPLGPSNWYIISNARSSSKKSSKNRKKFLKTLQNPFSRHRLDKQSRQKLWKKTKRKIAYLDLCSLKK